MIHSRPLRELAAADAYLAAVERDTLEAYEEFLAAYPDDPMATRVRALLATRREAIVWKLTAAADTPQAYWSYLRRYPRGPHTADARRRLALRAFASEPPASFAPIDYDVPPPSSEELPYVERPVLEFADADFPPPPPLPIYFLPPPPLELIELPPPPPPIEVFALPIPIFVPIPVWCHRPVHVAPPPDNVIFNNIHNRVVINHVTNDVAIKNAKGQIVSSESRSTHGAAALGAALPGSLVNKAALLRQQRLAGHSQGPTPSALWRQRSTNLPLGRPLLGADGRPLPQLQGRPAAAGVGPTAGIAATTPPARPVAPGALQGPRPQTAAPHRFLTPPTLANPPQWQSPTAHSALGPAAPVEHGPRRPQLSPPAFARTAPVPPAYRPPAPTPPAALIPPAVHRLAPTPPPAAYRPPPQPPAHSAFGLAAPSRPQISAPSVPRIAPPPSFRPPAPPTQARVAPPPGPAYRPPPPPPAAAHAAVSRPAPSAPPRKK